MKRWAMKLQALLHAGRYVVYTVVALEALVNSTDFSEHSMVCPRSEPEGQVFRV